MFSHSLSEDYFEWLYNIACEDRYGGEISYRKLLLYLHETEFDWVIRQDQSRAKDGIGLRFRYVYDILNDPGRKNEVDGPCSMLEMMVALAIKCEDFMDDPRCGNRTSQWFWVMVNSLGLGHMYDGEFNVDDADLIMDEFFSGKVGLFKARNVRDIDIWSQMCAYTRNMV